MICFENLGFDKTTTAKIAERAGVGIGSLYRYFPDKSALLKAVMRKFTRENLIVFTLALEKQSNVSIEQTVENMISLSIDHFLKKRSFFIIFMTHFFQSSNQDIVFEARQNLARAFTDSLLGKFPEIQTVKNREDLVMELNHGFHAFMSALYAVVIEGSNEKALSSLQKNMSILFKSLFVSKNIH